MFSRSMATSTPKTRVALALLSVLALGFASLTMFVSLTYAVPQHGDPWMFFAFEGFDQSRDENTVVEEPQVDITGNLNVYNGPIHSNRNASVSGNDNNFTNILRYFDDFEETGGPNDFPPPGATDTEPQQAPSVLNWPGTTGPGFTEPTCQFGTRSTPGDKAMLASDPDGVYCLDNGKFTLGANNLGTQAAPRQWTFITDGLIDVSGEGNWIVPAPNGDGVLAYTTSNLPSAIQWAGNLGGARGLAHAPNGHVDVEGNENVYCLQIVAQRVEVGGNENVWGWPCAALSLPSPTPTPTPTPTPSPTPTQPGTVATPTPTPTPTATIGEGQLGGNPTPTPRAGTVPNTALTSPAIQVPAAVLAVLALISLGVLLRARLEEASRR